MTTTTAPYQIIFEQLGGRRFVAMTGTKNFTHSNEGRTLTMQLTRNKAKAKFLQITLTDQDLYDMVFTSTVGKKYEEQLVEVARFEGVYADMLQSLFAEVTGLYTNL